MTLFPCFFPVKLEIYKIQIKGCTESVYMRQNTDLNYVPVMIETDIFLKLWGDSPRIEDPPFLYGVPYTSVPELWHLDRKLNKDNTGQYFAHGITNPVPFSKITYIYDNQIFFLDGITRMLWLLCNNVKVFYLDCPENYADELNQLILTTSHE